MLNNKKAQMDKILFGKVSYVALLLMLTACQAAGQPLSASLFKPGDTLDGMSLTTSAKDAAPLWVFCSPTQSTGNTTTSECSVPIVPRLAIGYLLLPENDSLLKMDWSEIDWKLTVDDQPIDLKRFGIYSFIRPVLLHAASPVREIFVSFPVWDVVLTDLKPGKHTIHGSAKMGTDSYRWIIHLAIVDNDPGMGMPWAAPGTQEFSSLSK
jgi:hypothetical protein